jgi:D-alanine-D-alanine ligase
MKPLRIQVLMHESLIPPDSMEGIPARELMEWKTEFDVMVTLHNMGHEAEALGVHNDLDVFQNALVEKSPDIVFNLLEEFHSVPHYDQHVVSYLELKQQPYTGCNPRGLMLSHDKTLAKKLLTFHKIPTPRFQFYPRGKTIKKIPKKLRYPLIVKSAMDDASLGIAQASIVRDEHKLRERVAYLWEEQKSDVLVEEYIEGREFYVGVLGNERLEVLPVWELSFENLPLKDARIATARAKWDPVYQKKIGVKTAAARDLTPKQQRKIEKITREVYRVLDLSGYARMDFRMSEEGDLYVLEANPNPNLSFGEDFAESAELTGTNYEQLLQKIINLGLNYKPAWKTVS